MTAEVLENALIEAIRDVGLEAGPFSEPISPNPNETKTRVRVGYRGIESVARDCSGARSEQVWRIDIRIAGPALRGAEGVYDCSERIRNRLEGYAFPGAPASLELEKEVPTDESDGIWRFDQHWKLKCILFHERQDPFFDRPLGA